MIKNKNNLAFYLGSINWLFYFKIKLIELIRLNIVALGINYQYKLKGFPLLFVFICIIGSIIFRSNLINIDLLYNNNYINIIIGILIILSSIYCIKLIFDIMNRCIQAYKVIPEFIKMHNNKVLNIKSIMNIYYIQHIFFILLPLWILYNITSKLNLFINSIDIFIITLGVIGSIVFFHFYSINSFNFDNNIKNYPIWVYLLLLLFAIFYIFIFPLIIINIIDSDEYIKFKKEFINNCIKSVEPNYMDDNQSNIMKNNTIENSNNTISLSIIPNQNMTLINNNSIMNSNNIINIGVINTNQIDTMNDINKKGFFENLFMLNNKLKAVPSGITNFEFDYYYETLINKSIEQDPINKKLFFRLYNGEEIMLQLDEILNNRQFQLIYLNDCFQAFTYTKNDKVLLLTLDGSSSKYLIYKYLHLDATDSTWQNSSLLGINSNTYFYTLKNFIINRNNDFRITHYSNNINDFSFMLLEKDNIINNQIAHINIKNYILYKSESLQMYLFKTKYGLYYFNCNSIFKIPYLIEEYYNGTNVYPKINDVDKKYLELGLKYKKIKIYNIN
jgi:hypothetical protein